jgi:hypothetical protein
MAPILMRVPMCSLASPPYTQGEIGDLFVTRAEQGRSSEHGTGDDTHPGHPLTVGTSQQETGCFSNQSPGEQAAWNGLPDL